MTKASGTMFVAENVRLSVRQHGPMTIPEMASVLRWNVKRTARAVKIACGYRWLTVIAKQPSGHFVYGAVQPIEERFSDESYLGALGHRVADRNQHRAISPLGPAPRARQATQRKAS